MELIVAEKPSVARDIARVLGANQRGEGCLKGTAHVVTWCVGHLVELEEPGAYKETWKRWRLDALPMVPESFKLRPTDSSVAQWRVVRDLLRSKQFTAVINACDAGREGELIFRLCYELAGSRLPTRRLWISSMTDAALRSGFAALKPGTQYDALADAARCRSEADWLVGMNATRAVTTKARQGAGAGSALLSIGRVQTPTLSLVVERERTIQKFVPRDYWEVAGLFSTPEGVFHATYAYLGQKRLGSLDMAKQLVTRLESHRDRPTGPRVESLEKKNERQPPPQLFDLTTLQRTANKRYGLSAQRTLDIAQALYETHKLVTYPRTDSRHLSTDIRNELPKIFQALTASPTYGPFAQPLLATPPGPTPRVFNNNRVTDHHAIIPTSKAPHAALDRDEQRVYDMIVRRFLGAFYPDAEFALTTLVVLVGADADPPRMPDPAPARDTILDGLPEAPDRLHARGKVLLKPGWREVAGLDDTSDEGPSKGGDDDEPSQRLPPLAQGQKLSGRFDHAQKKTRPPPRYTEASLLSAMEFAGREMDDDALRHALKDRGLGTPATRASIIETLLKRGYLERQQKNLVPTQLGCALIDVLPARSLASAELTGEWEARLARMARGQENRADFMRDIVGYVRTVVDQVRASAPSGVAAGAAGAGGPAASPALAAPTVGPCPLCQGPVVEAFKVFGCQRCPFKLWKSIAGKNVSPKLAAVLLHRRKTQPLQGFRSKAGKPFQAALELDATGQVKFVFSDAPAPARTEDDDDGDAPPRPPPARAASPAASPTTSAPLAPLTQKSTGRTGARAPRAAKSARAPRAAKQTDPPRKVPLLPPLDSFSPTPPATQPHPSAAHAPPTRPSAQATAPSPTPPPVGAAEQAPRMPCPACREGHMVTGKKAWGCSRWREGCKVVIPFTVGDKAITDNQLRELVEKGRTSRKASWPRDGATIKGHLRLDLQVTPPAVVVEG